jgi:hypothetical protein
MDNLNSSHRQSYISDLLIRIDKKAKENDLTFANATVRVVLESLGYTDSVTYIDGHDRGIDAWVATDAGIEIFQVKTHEVYDGVVLDDKPFDNAGVKDLHIARSFLLTAQPTEVKVKRLRELLFHRDAMLHAKTYEENPAELPITLHLIILGDALTTEAKAAFESLQVSLLHPEMIGNLSVQFRAVIHTIDSIIDVLWKQDNTEWIDRSNQKRDYIILRPSNDKYMSENQNAIFYCKAIDLVKAYYDFGYQLFETNVRANIVSSDVNADIRQSISRQRGRKEFRFLNNGVTIICNNFIIPRSQSSGIKVIRPAIVNGLQTVVALHDAYHYELDPRAKRDFENDCSVLVRLLDKRIVEDIDDVVKSTNNQNPMKPRNLKSNSSVQLDYAKFFARLDWFYETKEGAWNAFKGDSKRWRPQLNRDSDSFLIGGKNYRVVDNQTLAQHWLAFVGLAYEAINKRKELFYGDYYDLIFMSRTQQHGYDANLNMQTLKMSALKLSPDPSLMLVAHLAKEFAGAITPSAKQNRAEAVHRKRIDPSKIKSPTQLDAKLLEDKQYQLNKTLSGMSILFVEFVGFILFRSFGSDLHLYGHDILQNHTFNAMKRGVRSFDEIRALVETKRFEKDDLLVILWLIFVDIIREMMRGSWGDEYEAAKVKVRYIFGRLSREVLAERVENYNDVMQTGGMTKTWAVGAKEGQSLFEFIRACVRQG